MRKLYEAQDRIEAQILVDYLLAMEVKSVIVGDYLAGAIGELPANIYPEVWVVRDEDLTRSLQLLSEFTKINMKKAENGPWCCPNCGEEVDAGFDICWNCATPRQKNNG